MHTHTCTRTHAHIHAYTHMHTHAHNTCTQTHTCTHTHMHQVLHLHAVNHALGRLNPPLSKNESEDKEKDVLTSWLSKLRLSQNAIDSILNLPSQTELANRARCVCVCVCLTVEESGRECVHCTLSQQKQDRFSLLFFFGGTCLCVVYYI